MESTDILKESTKPVNWDRYHKWISDPVIKFLMRPYLFNREFALLVPSFEDEQMKIRSTRMLNAPNVQAIDFFYKVTGLLDRYTFYNFYNSVAKYKDGIPKIPYNRDLRKSANSVWINSHWKSMSSYDLFIDIDGDIKIIDELKESALMVHEFLDHLNVPYYLRWSGNGFHFVIPYDLIVNDLFDILDSTDDRHFDPDNDTNIYKTYGQIATYMSKYMTELIDPSIYDPRRLIKTPYSIVNCQDGFRICTPIKVPDLNKFCLDDVTPQPDINNTKSGTFPITDTLYNPKGSGLGLKLLLDKIKEGGLNNDN